MEIAVTDPGIDLMLTMMTPLPPSRPPDAAFIESRMQIIGDMVRASPVPVFLCSNTCLDQTEYAQQLLADNGLHLMPGADLAMTSLGHLMRWVDQRDRILSRDRPTSAGDAARPASSVGSWAEDEGRELLVAAGVPMVPARLVRSAAEAAEAARELGGPTVLKVCSRDIPHKSDLGGVVLGVSSPDAVADAYDRMLATVARAMPAAEVRGALVSPMREAGVELLVGVTVDPTFGPVLAVGLGGIWVELLEDVSLRVLPVDAETVGEMLTELRGAAMLHGSRGTKPVDIDAVSDVIVSITRAALSLGDTLDTLEVNPLRISSSGVEGLDVLVTTRSPVVTGE